MYGVIYNKDSNIKNGLKFISCLSFRNIDLLGKYKKKINLMFKEKLTIFIIQQRKKLNKIVNCFSSTQPIPLI